MANIVDSIKGRFHSELVANPVTHGWVLNLYRGGHMLYTNPPSPNGHGYDPNGKARIPASIPDGTSNTILMAEKYARCTNSAYPDGGSYWDYWGRYATGGPWYQAPPLFPAFALSWNASSIGPASKFQVLPSPYLGRARVVR